jgi:lipopolysaccharide transport system permease protein
MSTALADPVRGWLTNVGSARYLISHRRLLWRVSKNDLRQRHAGSFLGFGWTMLAPLLVLAIYALIYLEIFRIRVPELTSLQYVFYVFCGLVPYLMCAEALSIGVSAVVANKSVLNNTVFPVDLTPVKPVITTQVVMATGMVVVVTGAALTGRLHLTILLLPVIWFFNVLWLIGLNWILSLLNVIVRDLQNLISATLMIMLVASPIAYTPDMVPSALKPLLALNPFAYFVVAYQQIIMLGIWPRPLHLSILIMMSVITFGFGSWFFDRAKRVIIDYV